MDLREKIIEVIKDEWDRTRPLGGVGRTDSQAVYSRLRAYRIDVSGWAMANILEDLWNEGWIKGTPNHEGTPYYDREGRQVHGARPIIGPEG